MCITFPHQVISVQPPHAVIKDGRHSRQVRIDGVSALRPGQWLLVQADAGIRTVSDREAKEIISYFQPA